MFRDGQLPEAAIKDGRGMCRREALWCAFNTGPAGTPGIRGAVAKRFD